MGSVPSIPICELCEQEHQLLVRGLQAEYSGLPPYIDPNPEQSIGWYEFAGLRDTIHNIRQQPTKSLNDYRDSFRNTVRALGVKPSLTSLHLHYYISNLATEERPSSYGEVGLPPKMTQYGIAVAATVPPIPTYDSLTSPADRLELLNEYSPREFTGGFKSRSNRVYGQFPDQLIQDLRGVFSATRRDVNPIEGFSSRSD